MLNPSVDFVDTKARVKFNGDCLRQEKITFNHGKIVNIYIIYEIERSVSISSYPTLENCLFSAIKLAKYFDVICTNMQDMVSDLIEKDLIQLAMKSVEK